MGGAGLVSRGLTRVREFVASATHLGKAPDENDLERLRIQLQECAEGRGGEVSTRQRAARLAETYLRLDDAGRHAFLRLIAHEFGPAPARVAPPTPPTRPRSAPPQQWDAEADLRAALRSRRHPHPDPVQRHPAGRQVPRRPARRPAALPAEDPLLKPLDRELESRLSAWFDVGFLELQRITWNSPAALLEKLIEYEAVHEIRSWTDLKNRLDSDRRLLRLLPSAHAAGAADLRRGGAAPRSSPTTCRRCSTRRRRCSMRPRRRPRSSIRSPTRRPACAACPSATSCSSA
jgi:malonyl-CoA decarboxylase